MDPETVERKKANAKAVVFLFFLSFSLKLHPSLLIVSHVSLAMRFHS
jgi:hypothetical protein